jgi:hypothetical protein
MNAPLNLAAVPVVDVRGGGPPRHARDARARARALRDDCVAWLPRATLPALPLLDGVTRRWLSRSASPYVPEVATIAADLNFPGIWFLNGSYQWGCTSRGCEEGGVPWLMRTLDWPFPGLGRHVEVARMAGPAGDYWSVTWPGAAVAAHPPQMAAGLRHRPQRGRHLVGPPHSARPAAAPGIRDLRQLCASQAPPRERPDRASGDLHPGRLPPGRALRHRAHRGRLCHP